MKLPKLFKPKNVIDFIIWILKESVIVFIGVFVALYFSNLSEERNKKKEFQSKLELSKLQVLNYLQLIANGGIIQQYLLNPNSLTSYSSSADEFIRDNLMDFPISVEQILNDNETTKYISPENITRLANLVHTCKNYDLGLRSDKLHLERTDSIKIKTIVKKIDRGLVWPMQILLINLNHFQKGELPIMNFYSPDLKDAGLQLDRIYLEEGGMVKRQQ